jgi:hypothetical protein
MAKKNTPIITHTEILCLAIESLQAQIREWDEKMRKAASVGEEAQKMVAELREHEVARLDPKLEALKDMYNIETGANYN